MCPSIENGSTATIFSSTTAYIKAGCSNKNYEKNLEKYILSNLFLDVLTLEFAILPKNELLHK